MTGKPFISARIPEELLEQLESRVIETKSSKSHVLVEALTEYLDPEKSNNEDKSGLEKRFRVFENWVSAVSTRLMMLENKIDLLETPRRSESIRRNTPEIGEGTSAKSLPAAKEKQSLPTTKENQLLDSHLLMT